jgi:SHS family lactate transporter-like MFS transporter
MVPVFLAVIVLTALGKERRGIRFGTAETSAVASGAVASGAVPETT